MFHQTCLGLKQKRPPVWLMRQAGRYLPEYLREREKFPDFIEFCLTPDIVTKVTLQPIERFDFDAAIIFSDILMIPQAMGQKVWFEAGHGPKLAPLPLSFNPEWEENLALVYQAIRQTRQALSQSKSLIGFAGTPWTVGAYMMCQNKIGSKENLQREAQKHDVSTLIQTLIPIVAQHLINQVKAGCDVVQLFDSWASYSDNTELELIEPLRQILKLFWQTCPNTPVIYYGRGVSHLYQKLDDIEGPLVLGFDQDAPNLNTKRVTQGNLDPDILIQGGDVLKKAIEKILYETQGKPHIFNLGHGIKPETPIKHVEQMIEWVRNPD